MPRPWWISASPRPTPASRPRGWCTTRTAASSRGSTRATSGSRPTGSTGEERVEWYVEAAANPTLLTGFRPTDEGDRLTSSTAPLYRLARADLCRRETEVAELVADLEVLDGLRRSLPDDQRAGEMLDAIEAALDALDLADVRRYGGRGPRRAGRRPRHAPAAPGGHTISAVGHAHIDSAWLWPVRETVRKVARTVANVVQLMDTDASLVYAMSSAQQWAWLEGHTRSCSRG